MSKIFMKDFNIIEGERQSGKKNYIRFLDSLSKKKGQKTFYNVRIYNPIMLGYDLCFSKEDYQEVIDFIVRKDLDIVKVRRTNENDVDILCSKIFYD